MKLLLPFRFPEARIPPLTQSINWVSTFSVAKTDGNVCLSPYSIQSALAMTYAGSDGDRLSGGCLFLGQSLIRVNVQILKGRCPDRRNAD
jgi:hypothetical protein